MKYLFVLLILAGCVTIPKKEVDETRATSVALEKTEERALASSTFEAGEWPSETWWEMFNDEQLGDLIKTALENNPSLKQAKSSVERAQQMAQETRSSLFPELDASAGFNYQHQSKYGLLRAGAPQGLSPVPAAFYLIDLGLNFRYEFDFWGKNRRRFQAALGRMQVQRAEENQAKLVISTAMAEAYFHLQTHVRVLVLLEEILKDRRSLLWLSAARTEKGLDPKMDQLNAQEGVFEIQKRISISQAQVESDRHLLATLAGSGPDLACDVVLEISGVNTAIPLPQNLSTDLLARRPDLMAQIWRVEAAAEEIGVAKTAFYPSIDLTALAGLESFFFNKLFSIHSFSGSLYPAIHLPIFTAGRIKAHLKAKEAEFDTEVYTYQALLLQAAKEVADGVSFAFAAEEELSVQKNKRQTAEKRYALIYARYAEGVGNYLDVLRSQDEVSQERLREAELTYKKLGAVLSLIKALGGGYYHD